jgi:hypothetical protein
MLSYTPCVMEKYQVKSVCEFKSGAEWHHGRPQLETPWVKDAADILDIL